MKRVIHCIPAALTAMCLIMACSCGTASHLDYDSISTEGIRTVRVKPFAMKANGKWLRLSLERSVDTDNKEGWCLVADYYLPFLTGDKMCFHLDDGSKVTLTVTNITRTERRRESVLTPQGEKTLRPGTYRAMFPVSEQTLQQLCGRATEEITGHSVNAGWSMKISKDYIMDFPWYIESARDVINGRLELQKKNMDWTKIVI